MKTLRTIACTFVIWACLTPNVLAMPIVHGFTVETYANVTDPVKLAFDPTGVLYVGRDNTGSGGGGHDSVRIHRIGLGGSPVEEYGNPIRDPDGVLFDATGTVAGIPGSVLVSGITDGTQGQISAILPDESVTTVVGPTTELTNPAAMVFDSTGRVLVNVSIIS